MECLIVLSLQFTFPYFSLKQYMSEKGKENQLVNPCK